MTKDVKRVQLKVQHEGRLSALKNLRDTKIVQSKNAARTAPTAAVKKRHEDAVAEAEKQYKKEVAVEKARYKAALSKLDD